jgi:membrane-associated phospholipid phosphatase
LGGGIELLALVIIAFLIGSRPKFFYYAACFALDKSLISLFKLIYHDPRPYMASSDIQAYSCSKEFGNPSGHSFSSSLTFSMLFLDIFYGENVFKNNLVLNQDNKFLKAIFFVLGLSWAASIPFSRYLLGVHSLDQVIYGSSLGIWAGLSMHFFLRDHILIHT